MFFYSMIIKKKHKAVSPVLFRLIVCDKARDTIHENVFRFVVFKL